MVPFVRMATILSLIVTSSYAYGVESSRLQFDSHATSGGALWHGSLKDEAARPFYGLNLSWLAAVTTAFGVGFQIDYSKTSLSNNGAGFTLESEKDLDVSTISFIPSLCHLASKMQLCGGIGQGTVNVNGTEERRDFGSWTYTAAAKFFWDQYSFMTMARYVGQIEETTAEGDREMGFKSLGIGIGYSLNPLILN
jgi:hypothetical protein